MKRKAWAKLRGKAGESIGETLVALLISSLALLMLAGAISAAANMVNTSKASMNEYYTKNWTGSVSESNLVIELESEVKSGS